MKKLLFVSYYVPPRTDVAARRSEQILKYLPRYGWDITTITAAFEAGAAPKYDKTIVTPYVEVRSAVKTLVGLRNRSAYTNIAEPMPIYGRRQSLKERVLRLAYAITTYPDQEVGWTPYAIAAIRRTVSTTRYDAVLSSAPPHVTSIAVAMGKGPVPWVADLRDLWTGVDYYGDAPIRGTLNDALERLCLRRASVFTAVSEPMTAYLATRYPSAKTVAIPNAYDPQEWTSVPFGSNQRCTLLFGGQLYGGRGGFPLLFQALRSLLDEGAVQREELSLEFYCRPAIWLDEQTERYGLQGVIKQCGLIPRPEFMPTARRADRLVLVLWDGEGAEGILRGRLFEYLGARRPIIAVGGPASSAIDGVLAESSSGQRYLEIDALKREIVAAVQEHRAGRIRTIDEHAAQKFDADHLAAGFNYALNEAVTPPIRK